MGVKLTHCGGAADCRYRPNSDIGIPLLLCCTAFTTVWPVGPMRRRDFIAARPKRLRVAVRMDGPSTDQ
jgi:hypothetical protein